MELLSATLAIVLASLLGLTACPSAAAAARMSALELSDVTDAGAMSAAVDTTGLDIVTPQ